MISGSLEYSVTFALSARKELERLAVSVGLRVLKKIENLPANPRPPGCKKLSGQNSLWRIRVGDYRVVYSIDDSRRVIDITVIRHRSDVYRDGD